MPQQPTLTPTDRLRAISVPQSLPSVPYFHSPVPHHPDPLEDQTSIRTPSFEPDLPPMTIPVGHSTTTESLLASNNLKSLVGDFPRDIFLNSEAKRPIPDLLSLALCFTHVQPLSAIPIANTSYLVEAYFEHFHAETPFLHKADFWGLFHAVQATGLQDDVDSALCLVVLAIGSIATTKLDGTDEDPVNWAPGRYYLSSALKILVRQFMISFGTSIALPQALLLAARYFGYLLLPLQSWRLVHMASTNIQHLWYQAQVQKSDLKAVSKLIVTSWAIFDAECDLIAEHQLPRSGMEHIIDRMTLPTSDDENSGATICWLAELSARRLLNRVHHVMYDDVLELAAFKPKTPRSDGASVLHRPISSVAKTSMELNRQLESWFDLLPPAVKPDLHKPSTWQLQHLNILLRYHSAKDIIFRPFVMYVCNLPSNSDVPGLIMGWCNACIDHCRAYIDIAVRRLASPSCFSEIILHSIFASTIVLTLASLSPYLTGMVSDIAQLQVWAIDKTRHFAFNGSSIEDLLWILKLLHEKTKVLQRRLL